MADQGPVRRSYHWLVGALLGILALEALLWLLRHAAGWLPG